MREANNQKLEMFQYLMRNQELFLSVFGHLLEYLLTIVSAATCSTQYSYPYMFLCIFFAFLRLHYFILIPSRQCIFGTLKFLTTALFDIPLSSCIRASYLTCNVFSLCPCLVPAATLAILQNNNTRS